VGRVAAGPGTTATDAAPVTTGVALSTTVFSAQPIDADRLGSQVAIDHRGIKMRFSGRNGV
jgi:hypothetical protein